MLSHPFLRASDAARPRRTPTLNDEHGQSLIEFTLSFPLLLGLLIGLVSMAWVFYSYVTVTLAAREGASAIVHDPYLTVSQVRDIVRAKSIALDKSSLTDDNIVIEPDPSLWVSGVKVSVTVKYVIPLPTLTVPALGGSRTLILAPFEIRATSSMTID